ncbi:MAG: hypothetical protein LBJ95_02275 [Oscillospiraceae bacterium]|jgi:hypothetical protein|nr:hypothetical protein [Oscillospiraceae bacterium]
MQFSAKKLMSLVFAAGVAAATFPSLRVLGGKQIVRAQRALEIVGFDKGVVSVRVNGTRLERDNRWLTQAHGTYDLASIAESCRPAARTLFNAHGDPYAGGRTHPSVIGAPAAQGPDTASFQIYTNDRGYDDCALGNPQERLDYVWEVDLSPGPWQAAATCDITVLKFKTGHDFQPGHTTMEELSGDVADSAAEALGVHLYCFHPDGAFTDAGLPILRVCVMTRDETAVVEQTYDVNRHGIYTEEQLENIVDTTRRREIPRQPGPLHGDG